MFCAKPQAASKSRLALQLRLNLNNGGGNGAKTVQPVRNSGHDHAPERWPPLSATQYREMAQGRDYVGFGLCGEPIYSDRIDNPYPAIRFRKNDPEILKLREKEKGDWRKLTLEEKKQLYRASFANTLTEILAPRGHWKAGTAVCLFAINLAMIMMITFKKLCASKDRQPKSLSNEHKEKKLQTWINCFSEPIDGVASKWDYEKGRWKA